MFRGEYESFDEAANKIQNKIEFKPDLSNYLLSNENLKYRLVAIVAHVGQTKHGSHYTTNALTSLGKFHNFNDDFVNPVSAEVI